MLQACLNGGRTRREPSQLMRDPAITLVIGMIVGFALGYGIREFISRPRRQAARDRRDLGLD